MAQRWRVEAFRKHPMLPVLVPALLAAVYGWANFVSTFSYPGSIGPNYLAPGTDWMVLYGAARLALEHHLALTSDGGKFTAYLNTSFAHFLPAPLFYRPFVYPPSLLVLLLPFGLLGLMGSYALFQGLTAALLAGALWYRPHGPHAPGWTALAALACPAAAVNVVDGQCSFLITGLLVLGFRLLERRPVLAGCVLGLVSVKPQLGLMVPVALLAMRQWRGIFGAAMSCCLLVVASALVLGAGPWLSWGQWLLQTNASPSSVWVASGRLWGESVYACAVLLHVSPRLSSALQLIAIAVSAVGAYLAFRGRGVTGVSMAVLLAATILAAPHSGDYDEVMLTVAAALWISALPAPVLKDGIICLFLWLAPFFGPPILVPAGRIMPLLVAGFIVLALTSPATSMPKRAVSV
jgi:hypothetical protein